jgi:predicted DNA-binding transcriptional regulator YafY
MRARSQDGSWRARAAVAEAARKASVENDVLQMTVSFERLEDAHRVLLSLGDRVEVLAPPELRRAILRPPGR